MGLSLVRIRDLVDGLFDGPHATPPPAGSGPIFLGIHNITDDGHLVLDDVRHINEDDFDQWTKRVIPQAGDIVFTYEATLNRYAIIPVGFRGCLGRRLALLRVNKSKANARYLHYAFFSREWRATIRANTLIGATVDRIPLSKFLDFPIRVHARKEQDAVADVLSAYDDLIENNVKRIKILEEMARSLYREWFVEFRFPGHKEVKSIKAATLQVPDGWRAETLGDWALNFDSKRRPLSGAQRAAMKGDYPYYGAAKIIDRVNAYLFDGRYLLVAEDGSVITADRRPVLQIASGRFWVNNHTHILQGKAPVSTDLLYLRLKELDVSPYITGAAQPKITQANLNRIPLLVPPPQLLGDFDKLVGPLLTLTETLQSKNDTLMASRDLLLPRLLSGEIELHP